MKLNAFAAWMMLGTVPLLAAPAFAETLTYKADLTTTDEVPPHPDLKGSGHVEASVDTGSLKMTYHVDFQGLTGKALAAHFHGPAGPGKNAGVQVPVAGGIMSPMDGSATLTPDQLKMLQDGQLYFNVHTEANKTGEIRGQMAKAM